MIGFSRPRIEAVEVLHARAFHDGRTPVLITLSGWGLARLGGQRRRFWGRQSWQALVPVPGTLRVSVRNLWGHAEHTEELPGHGPSIPRLAVEVSGAEVRLRSPAMHVGLRLPFVPRFDFSSASEESSDE